MSPANGVDNLITYDLATLTLREILRANLRGRFPRARDPLRKWAASLLGLTVCSGGLGLIVGMALWPRFQVETMVVAFGMVGPLVAVLTVAKVQRTGRRLRAEGQCTTELTPDGVIRRTLTRECKYRWVTGQKFVVLGHDVLIFLRRDEILWLPRRAFPSHSAIDEFLTTAQRYHADATTRLSDATACGSGGL
jgi:hypothetical protein